jgi:hypothetical protein
VKSEVFFEEVAVSRDELNSVAFKKCENFL